MSYKGKKMALADDIFKKNIVSVDNVFFFFWRGAVMGKEWNLWLKITES